MLGRVVLAQVVRVLAGRLLGGEGGLALLEGLDKPVVLLAMELEPRSDGRARVEGKVEREAAWLGLELGLG